MIQEAIERAIKKKRERNYPYTYWAIDLHETIIKPSYKKYSEDDSEYTFYPGALPVLQRLSRLMNQKLILWTSSHADPIIKFVNTARTCQINFDFINSNEDCPSNELSSFKDKFYFDILIDDKAGFTASLDWKEIERVLNIYPEFNDESYPFFG